MDEKLYVSAKAHVTVALETLGLPIRIDPNFQDTPARWTKYLQSYMQKYDPKQDLEKTFKKVLVGDDTTYENAMIVQVGIPYRAVCAHHLLPVLGTAHVGYIPNAGRVVGLSKLARLVYGFSHSTPSLQEDICNAVTHALMIHLKPQGAMCVISAEHGCMAARGVEEATGQIRTVTASIKGVFIDKTEARDEFYRLVALGV